MTDGQGTWLALNDNRTADWVCTLLCDLPIPFVELLDWGLRPMFHGAV
jgi:hypothetical protein